MNGLTQRCGIRRSDLVAYILHMKTPKLGSYECVGGVAIEVFHFEK